MNYEPFRTDFKGDILCQECWNGQHHHERDVVCCECPCSPKGQEIYLVKYDPDYTESQGKL